MRKEDLRKITRQVEPSIPGQRQAMIQRVNWRKVSGVFILLSFPSFEFNHAYVLQRA